MNDKEETRRARFYRKLLSTIALVAIVVIVFSRDFSPSTRPGEESVFQSLGFFARPRDAGLDILDVDAKRDIENGAEILVVRGTVANPSDRPRAVPIILVTLADGENRSVDSATVEPSIPSLEPGGQSAFAVTFRAPARSVRRVDVTFIKGEATEGGEDSD